MGARVIKFGGSNLRRGSELDRLAAAVGAGGEPLVVVVSALHGVTDRLERGLPEVVGDRAVIGRLIRWVRQRHQRFLQEGVTDAARRRRCLAELDRALTELGKRLLGIHCLGEVPDFAADEVLSYGERLSARVVATGLVERGIACRVMGPEELGLVTDGIHRTATVDLARSRATVAAAVGQAGGVVVMPGFYGVSPRGRVTLLGRGGSDYAAAAVAHCLGAATLDIYKDVAGFMSADPRLVPAAGVIPRLTYREAAELAYFGARILHPRTFEPLRRPAIPIRLFHGDNGHGRAEPRTVIGEAGEVSAGVIKSVTASDDVGILRIQGFGVGMKPGLMADVTARLNREGINIRSVITSQTAINLLLSRADAGRAARVVAELDLPAVEEVGHLDDVAVVAVVGEGLMDRPGIAARVFGAVSARGINVLIIASGASSVAAYFIVNRADRLRAIRAIHKEFIG